MNSVRFIALVSVIFAAIHLSACLAAEDSATHISIRDGGWVLNEHLTNPGTAAEGLLMNVRMVNSTFEDLNKSGFDAEANSDRFIAKIPDYAAEGVNAFTLCLQGGAPGYEGALNSAFEADGSLRETHLKRVERVIRACDRHGIAVILGCFYQRQDQCFQDEEAIRTALVGVVRWIQDRGFSNVVLEVTNEYGHSGFDYPILETASGQVELIKLAKKTYPQLLISTSGGGGGVADDTVAEVCDFLLVHYNNTLVEQIPNRITALRKHGKPIVCNEDDKLGADGARALELSVLNGASWGFMHEKHNQRFPFHFSAAADDAVVYAKLRELTGPYFPPPESQGGWRELNKPEDIRRLGGMDPQKLDELREWLMLSDHRTFAATIIRHGYIVLEVERGNSAVTDARRVASVSKAVCATVLAIAAEQSQQGQTPRKMSFDDKAFDFIPWAQPLSDPRKSQITVKQLLNHTSGICPEATGAPNDGKWDYILGHSGDVRTANLAFDPGTGCGYSTHALAHAALVCETVTGKPYDEFAIEALFKPLGIEHWTFSYFDGDEEYGRHPSHGLGMPARDLARIGWCMLNGGRWGRRQVIPKWFIEQTAAPTHDVRSPEMRWKLNPEVFSHGWELPARHNPKSGRSGEGIPADARSKPGSGGQLIAFVPSLDIVISRQTGSSGDWPFEEYLRKACDAVLPP